MRCARIKRAAALSALWGACSCGTALAAEFELHPSLAVSEEYNDNIRDTPSDRKTDFVTRVQPGVALLYRTPRVSAEGSYAFEYRDYARGGREDETVHTLALGGNAALVENFLFVEANDTLSRVSLDVTRDVTAESLFVNQTDENRASVSAYLLWRLEKTVLKTGYRYTDVRYWGVSGGDSGIDKSEHRGYAELQYQPRARLSLNAAYSFGTTDTELAGYNQHDLSGGTRYEYADKCFVYGGIGNSWQDYDDGRDASNLFWHAGITHDFTFLVGTLEAVVQYTDDPKTVSTKETRYSATAERRLDQGTVGFSASYSDYEEPDSAQGNRRRAGVSGFGRFELSPRLSASLGVTADKVTGEQVDDYPYHFSGSGGLSYTFPHEVLATINYSHVQYRQEVGSSDGAKWTNRVIVEVKKVF